MILFKFLKRAVSDTVCFFIFLILRTLSLLINLGVGFIAYDRIGHLAANTELFLRRQAIKDKKFQLQIFLTPSMVANRQLLKMIKRRLLVIESSFLTKVLRKTKNLFNSSKLWIELPFETNEYYEFNQIGPQLSFTKKEEALGKNLLSKMHISAKEPFVCFHSRDRAYLDRIHAYRGRQEWTYHDFRDCNINNYIPAAQYLEKEGIYSLRMGSVVEEELIMATDSIIDYATNFRSDFADIYLAAKCKFFLGNTSGIRIISAIFNVPIAFANSIPLGDIALGKKDIFIPKKYWLIENKRFLSFREIIKMGSDWWLNGGLFKKAGIEVIENTATEILALTKEINERLDGKWASTLEDEELQQSFRALFPVGHRCFGFPSRIGAEFLRQNVELLN